MAPKAATLAAPPARPRSLRALMAARDIWTFTELARLSGVDKVRVTYVNQGWIGSPIVLSRLAKTLGVTQAEIVAAASLAHQGGAS